MAINSCFSFFILICPMIITSHAAPVDTVCAKTSNPPLCIVALDSPDTHNANLDGLAELSLQTVGIGVIKYVSLFKNFSATPRVDPVARANAEKCEELYDNMLKGLVVPVHEAVRVGRWADVMSPALQIVFDIDTCENNFNGNSPAHEGSRSIRVAAEAIAVISGLRLGYK